MGKKRIRYIDEIKGVAIISVICAHCNAVLDTENQWAIGGEQMLSNFGTAGVLCFFFLSGIMFHYNGCFWKYWKNKLVKFVPVWIISATVIYLYVYIRKPPISLEGYFNYIIGNGSYCYYMTMLIMIYACFTLIPLLKKKIILILILIITLISTLFCPQIGNLSPYLNCLNWIGYFSLGVLLRLENLEKFVKYIVNSRFKYIFPCVYVVFVTVRVLHNNAGGYWYGMNTVISWIGAITVIILGVGLSERSNKISIYIEQAGRYSLFIYLWHMPIAGIVARIMNLGWTTNLVLLRPFIIFSIMLFAINIGIKIFPDFIKRIIGLA